MNLLRKAARAATASNMDELHAAIYKATSDDDWPPKEKHIVTVLRLVGGNGSGNAYAAMAALAQADQALAKRLRLCRSPKLYNAAAKCLCVFRRLHLAGHTLVESSDELAAVCSGSDRNSQSDFVAQCAVLMSSICAWDEAWPVLRRLARGEKVSLPEVPPSSRLKVLEALQLLCRRAFDCTVGALAATTADRQSLGLYALRLSVVEDALGLFRAEHAAVSALVAVLLLLKESAMFAVALLETFAAHCRRAMTLQSQLVDEAHSPPFPSEIVRLLEQLMPWPAGVVLPSVPRLAQGEADDGNSLTAAEGVQGVASGGWSEAATSATSAASSVTGAAHDDEEERELLLRAVLESLPARSMAMLCERYLGGVTIDSVSKMSTLQLRQIPVAEAVLAARLARQHLHTPSGDAASLNEHRPPAMSGGGYSGGGGGGGGGGGASGGGGGGGGEGSRHAAVTDLEALQHLAGPTFAMPDVATARDPTLATRCNSSVPSSPHSQSSSRQPLPRQSPIGGHEAQLPADSILTPASRAPLPPLPVPFAELRPQLLHEPSTPAQLRLAAFEMLLMSTDRLGAGVRVVDVHSGSEAAANGISPGEILFTCDGRVLLGSNQAAAVLRSASDSSNRRARLMTLSGREIDLGGHAGGGAGGPRASGHASAAPFGLVHEALRRPQDHAARPQDHAGVGGRSTGHALADGASPAVVASATAMEAARREDETLASIRTRLNIPLRQQRWMLPLLRAPLASDPPPHGPPAPSAPAYRALLLLTAGGSGGVAGALTGSSSGSRDTSTPPQQPRTDEVTAFVERQVSLLRNAVSLADEGRRGGTEGGCGGGEGELGFGGGGAVLDRLEAQALRLLTLRFAPGSDDVSNRSGAIKSNQEQSGAIDASNRSGVGEPVAAAAAAAAGGVDASAERSEAQAVAATLRDLGISLGHPASGSGGGGGGHTNLVDLSQQQEQQPIPGQRHSPMGVMKRWPAALGYRLYSCLLEAIFESDEPAVVAENAQEVMVMLRLVWAPCAIDESRHFLALLSICFDHYQQSGAPQLVPLISDALDLLLGRLSASAGNEAAGAASVAGGRQWTASRVLQVVAGMAGYLSGKLRDYRGNFGCDPDELRSCAQLWKACVSALGGAGRGDESGGAFSAAFSSVGDESDGVSGGCGGSGAGSGGGSGGISFPRKSSYHGYTVAVASTPATREVDRQARGLIEASLSRHMRRVRLSIAPAAGVSAAIEADEANEAVPSEEALCALLAALGDEAEVEVEFATCLNGCVLPRVTEDVTQDVDTDDDDSDDGQTAATTRKVAGALRAGAGGTETPSPALTHALECFERDVSGEIERALALHNTISSSGMTLLQACLGLRAKLRSLGLVDPLPALPRACERMVHGWCDELPPMLITSLQRAIEADDFAPISDAALRTASVVDIFTQMDRLSHVYAAFNDLGDGATPLPSECHTRLLEIIEGQVCHYVSRLMADCAPLPISVLQAERRGSELAGGHASTATAGRKRGGRRRGGGGGGDGDGDGGGVQRDPRVDAFSISQLCLRLNDCEWAGEQLLALAARLRADVPGLGQLPGAGVAQCERSCRDLVDYITARVVYYELEPALLALYSPPASPETARLRPLLVTLEPMLTQMRRLAAPRWAQRLLESVVSTFAMAVGAILELPSRHFAPHHKAMLDEDVAQAITFFEASCRGVVDEQVVPASLNFLYSMATQACLDD